MQEHVSNYGSYIMSRYNSPRTTKVYSLHEYMTEQHVDPRGIPDMEGRVALEYVKIPENRSSDKIVQYYYKTNKIGPEYLSKTVTVTSPPVTRTVVSPPTTRVSTEVISDSRPPQPLPRDVREDMIAEDNPNIGAGEEEEGEAFNGVKKFIAKVQGIGKREPSFADKKEAMRILRALNSGTESRKETIHGDLQVVLDYGEWLCRKGKTSEKIYQKNADKVKLQAMLNGTPEGKAYIDSGITLVEYWDGQGQKPTYLTDDTAVEFKTFSEFMCRFKDSALNGVQPKKKRSFFGSSTGKAKFGDKEVIVIENVSPEDVENMLEESKFIGTYQAMQDELAYHRARQSLSSTSSAISMILIIQLTQVIDNINQLPQDQKMAMKNVLLSTLQDSRIKSLDQNARQQYNQLLANILSLPFQF